jgi:hypothetical protein
VQVGVFPLLLAEDQQHVERRLSFNSGSEDPRISSCKAAPYQEWLSPVLRRPRNVDRRALTFDQHNPRRTRLRLPTPLGAWVHLLAKLLRSVLQAAGQPTPHQSRRRKSTSVNGARTQRPDKRTLSRPPLIAQRVAPNPRRFRQCVGTGKC